VNLTEITPNIFVLIGDEGRSVLVRGHKSVTAVDIPADPSVMEDLLAACLTLAPEGLKLAILTTEPASMDVITAKLPGVQFARADLLHATDEDWESTPEEALGLTGIDAVLEGGCITIRDGGDHQFVVEPCLGSARSLAVTIEPEEVMVVCDDLHPTLPPRIRAGSVHETMMRLQDWRLRAPNFIIPASGIPLAGEKALETLDRGINYLRLLYQLTRSGLMESHLPWERLMYTIPSSKVWQTPVADKILNDRHRDNVRYMAEDIWKRVQAEAEETSLAA
jgi:hypothetical protein